MSRLDCRLDCFNVKELIYKHRDLFHAIEWNLYNKYLYVHSLIAGILSNLRSIVENKVYIYALTSTQLYYLCEAINKNEVSDFSAVRH